ncbi:MAG: DUF2933 domain-containing protein [Nitrospiraceae bacterium]|nr:MAG: DUF2933 domain-containing protein [Nitrospiraceae bacterium]
MEWVRENWVFIMFFVIFISMHLFGGGCCGPGGHKGHGKEEDEHKGHPDKEGKGGRGCH